MSARAWQVLEVSLAKGAETSVYRFHVGGINLSTPDRAPFHWTVQDVSDSRYDLTLAVMDDATRMALAALRENGGAK